jgi:hypothetical protein
VCFDYCTCLLHGMHIDLFVLLTSRSYECRWHLFHTTTVMNLYRPALHHCFVTSGFDSTPMDRTQCIRCITSRLQMQRMSITPRFICLLVPPTAAILILPRVDMLPLLIQLSSLPLLRLSPICVTTRWICRCIQVFITIPLCHLR